MPACCQPPTQNHSHGDDEYWDFIDMYSGFDENRILILMATTAGGCAGDIISEFIINILLPRQTRYFVIF